VKNTYRQKRKQWDMAKLKIEEKGTKKTKGAPPGGGRKGG